MRLEVATLQTDDGFHVWRMRNAHGLEVLRQESTTLQAKRVPDLAGDSSLTPQILVALPNRRILHQERV